MTVTKNLFALVAIFLTAPTLWVALTVPAFVAPTYLMLSFFGIAVMCVASWSLSNQNKFWLSCCAVGWMTLVAVANGL
jgi:hypothetical protein